MCLSVSLFAMCQFVAVVSQSMCQKHPHASGVAVGDYVFSTLAYPFQKLLSQ